MTAFSAEERQLLNDSVNEYLADRYGPARAVALARAEGPDGFGREEWADYARLGWLGLTASEEAGGAGGGLTEAGILFAAAGRHLVQEPLLPTLILGAGALARLGTQEQAAMIEEIAAGTRLMAFLHAEPDGGYARDHVQAAARRDGGGFVLNGAKGFALGAHAADTLLVSARIGGADGPVGLFLVPGDAAGVARVTAPALDGRRGATASFENVALGAGSLLGGSEDDRLADIEALLDQATLAICADSLGAMVAAAEITTEYLKTREQFGQKLSSFQVVQHRLADLHILCEETRAMVHAALTAADEGRPDAAHAIWRAKVQSARAARYVGAQGIQLHGGMGMTDGMAAGHYYKRLSMNQAMFGDAEWHLARLEAVEAASA